MKQIVLYSVVSLLFFNLTLQSKGIITDFQKVDSLSFPFSFGINDFELRGVSYDAKYESRDSCNIMLVNYNLESGELKNKSFLNLKDKDCLFPYYFNFDPNGVRIVLSTQSRPVRLTLYENENNIIKTYYETASYTRSISTYMNSISKSYEDHFYVLASKNLVIDMVSDGSIVNDLYKVSIVGDSLERELVDKVIPINQTSKDFLVLENDTYFTTITLYNKIIDVEPYIDSVSKINIRRYNKLTKEVDISNIDKDYSFWFVDDFAIDGRTYFLCQQQDTSIRNDYQLNSKATIFEYDFENNMLIKSRELSFNSNVGIRSLDYDEQKKVLYLAGYSKDNSVDTDYEYYSDYWITSFDNSFDKIKELSWTEAPEERYGEVIYKIQSDSRGIFIYKRRIDIVFEENSDSWFQLIDFDSITTVEGDSVSSVSISYDESSQSLKIYSDSSFSEVSVFDLSGAKVLTHYNNSIQNRINLKELTSGIYFVKVNNNIEKFIKY